MEVSSNLLATTQLSAPAQSNTGPNLPREQNLASTRSDAQARPQNETTEPALINNGTQPDSAALQAAGERIGTLLDVQA